MAGQVKTTPTFALTPSSERTPTAQNYLTNADFDWLNQFLQTKRRSFILFLKKKKISPFLQTKRQSIFPFLQTNHQSFQTAALMEMILDHPWALSASLHTGLTRH